uniref:Uncharacterized protein n=1 Tax=Glossina brevipalpis TaxID=37001 RepID=A0A1A9WNH8_9MUSC
MDQNIEKPKVKCKRPLQPVRWADAATEQLLQLIADEIKRHPLTFERPGTGQACCEKTSSRCSHTHRSSCCCQKNKLRCYKVQQVSTGTRKSRNEVAQDHSNKTYPYYEILNKTGGVQLKDNDLVFYINPITNEILDEESIKAFRPTNELESEMRNDGGGTNITTESVLSTDKVQPVGAEGAQQQASPKPSLSFSASVPNLHIPAASLGSPILKNKQSFQWTESVTDHFVHLILEEIEKNPGTFEKPTEQKFYKKISAICPQLKALNWTVLKRKVENFQISYIKARLWKKESGAAMSANGNEDTVIEYLNEICPYYDILDKIFGPDLEDEINAHKYSEQLINNNNNNTSEDDFKKNEIWSNDDSDIFSNVTGLNEEDSDPTINKAPSMPNMSQLELEIPQKPQTNNALLPKFFTDTNFSYPSATSNKQLSRQSITKKSTSQLILEKRKIEVEHEKLQLEQKKFNWQLEKEGTELKLKQKELEHQFELRKFELAKHERMEKVKIKLQLEHEERMKKYEMKMKLQNLAGL